MPFTNVTKIRGDMVKLPPRIVKEWRNAQVVIDASENGIFIQRVLEPGTRFRAMMDEFRKAARQTGLKRRTVAEVIAQVRREKN
jgi:hypothetical protein